MKQIVLLPRVYGQYRNRLFNEIESEIRHMVVELDVNIERLSLDSRGHPVINMTGPDEEFVINVLRNEFGEALSFHQVLPEKTYHGILIDVGKVGYGIYVDIGVIEPEFTDALVPLHKLRSQLSMAEQSTRKIAKNLNLVDYLPVDIKILETDSADLKIESEIDTSTLERIINWSNDDHERLLVFGANQSMIETALRITKHLEDIYEIEQLGVFEYALRCKRSTRASGIIAAIGPKLKGVPMHLFIPNEVEAKADAEA